MATLTPPSWDEIRNLIERVDRVCRESEFLRAQAERPRHQPQIWPDRRQLPRKHDQRPQADRSDDNTPNPEGSDNTL